MLSECERVGTVAARILQTSGLVLSLDDAKHIYRQILTLMTIDGRTRRQLLVFTISGIDIPRASSELFSKEQCYSRLAVRSIAD